MFKTRIVIVFVALFAVLLLFLLPKVVVEHDKGLSGPGEDSVHQGAESPRLEISQRIAGKIKAFRTKFNDASDKKNNAIFADSLAVLYREYRKYDSASYFAEFSASFFNTVDSWTKAGDCAFEALSYTFDADRQKEYSQKAQDYYAKAMALDPGNLDVKSKMAMTYISSSNPMQGIKMLKEVLAENPDNVQALFNLGMLSIQSGQYAIAIERLKRLTALSPNHTQGLLLLGIALMNTQDREGARQQFEKVKTLDKDSVVQAEVDSYLRELK